MKILKAYKGNHGRLYLCVNKIPKVKYEKIGVDYVGSDKNGYFSHYLHYSRMTNAFAGRELQLVMKDGTVDTIKDHWFDSGSYEGHGEFVPIGLGTAESLQNCYVYYSYNIQKDKLNELVKEYLTREKFYEYYEIEKWLKLQYKWYPLIMHGKELPFMMNKNGDVVEMETKEMVYCMYNVIKSRNVTEKYKHKTFRYFKLNHKVDGKLYKLEDMYGNVCKETLPKKHYKKLCEKYKNSII